MMIMILMNSKRTGVEMGSYVRRSCNRAVENGTMEGTNKGTNCPRIEMRRSRTYENAMLSNTIIYLLLAVSLDCSLFLATESPDLTTDTSHIDV
jgi:hypothetical protein